MTSTPFVRASELYDPATRTRISNPALEATDAEVRAAVEEVSR